MEARLGASLPASYREFLLRHNGGLPEPPFFGQWMLDRFLIIGDEPESIRHLWYMLELRREDLPADVIPVAVEQSGDDICIALAGENRGRVYKWSLEGRAPAEDNSKLFPWLDLGDDYQFKPDDWPGHPDLTLLAEDFAEFLDSFQDDPDEEAGEHLAEHENGQQSSRP